MRPGFRQWRATWATTQMCGPPSLWTAMQRQEDKHSRLIPPSSLMKIREVRCSLHVRAHMLLGFQISMTNFVSDRQGWRTPHPAQRSQLHRSGDLLQRQPTPHAPWCSAHHVRRACLLCRAAVLQRGAAGVGRGEWLPGAGPMPQGRAAPSRRLVAAPGPAAAPSPSVALCLMPAHHT